MPLPSFKISQGEAKSFPPMPNDVYQVELFDISAREVEEYNDKEKKQLVLSFQFTVVDDGEYRGRNIWRDYVPTELYISKKNGKNVLYQIVESIIMRELKKEEVYMMDTDFLNKLIGYQCRVTLKTKGEGDEKRNYIESFLPKKTSMTRLSAEERGKCKVKPKEDAPQLTEEMIAKYTAKNVSNQDDEIPTINIDDDINIPIVEPVQTKSLPVSDDEINVEDVPF